MAASEQGCNALDKRYLVDAAAQVVGGELEPRHRRHRQAREDGHQRVKVAGVAQALHPARACAQARARKWSACACQRARGRTAQTSMSAIMLQTILRRRRTLGSFRIRAATHTETRLLCWMNRTIVVDRIFSSLAVQAWLESSDS